MASGKSVTATSPTRPLRAGDGADLVAVRQHRNYVTPFCDSRRWQGFELRSGDVLVCTPPKCGTTWVQMLCAMLIHGTTQFSEPLSELSIWLDGTAVPQHRAMERLAGQRSRRIIKTHAPLDALPYDPRCAYVYCGRDPRDAFLSMVDHLSNSAALSDWRLRRLLRLPTGPIDANSLFERWLTRGEVEWLADGDPTGSVLGHAKSFWGQRQRPNFLFLHYADLRRNLTEQIRILAEFLGVTPSEGQMQAFAEAASLDAMRARADNLAPEAQRGVWKSNEGFFRTGRLGTWHEVLSPQSQSLYERISEERLGSALRCWLEGGSVTAGCPPRADELSRCADAGPP